MKEKEHLPRAEKLESSLNGVTIIVRRDYFSFLYLKGVKIMTKVERSVINLCFILGVFYAGAFTQSYMDLKHKRTSR